MSFVKLFVGLTLEQIETEINEWVIENSKTKHDQSTGRPIPGKKTNITQTEIIHLPNNNLSFQVLVTFDFY